MTDNAKNLDKGAKKGSSNVLRMPGVTESPLAVASFGFSNIHIVANQSTDNVYQFALGTEAALTSTIDPEAEKLVMSFQRDVMATDAGDFVASAIEDKYDIRDASSISLISVAMPPSIDKDYFKYSLDDFIDLKDNGASFVAKSAEMKAKAEDVKLEIQGGLAKHQPIVDAVNTAVETGIGSKYEMALSLKKHVGFSFVALASKQDIKTRLKGADSNVVKENEQYIGSTAA